uniref:Ammonium transporter AmtB-like domain-containing protein n=1 Tax=Capra hircus TaxID=9925 RepID=A0A8C2NBG9_CAPHI
MGSKYQESVRVWLPLWALMLEVVSIVLFFFFTSYSASVSEQKKLLRNYRDFQDVFIMATLGFGFLNTSLRRHCWSSIAFNLFLLALGVQLAVLLDGLLVELSLRKMVIDMPRILRATMSATSVLISAGVVLGKVNLLQLVIMTLIEVTAFSATRLVGMNYLDACLQRTLELHDTYGVHYTFGLPGLLGGIVNIVLMALQAQGIDESTRGYQVLIDFGALGFTIIMGVTSGLLTGLLLNLNIWKSTHKVHYFDDQSFWKFPRLAVGY